MRLSDRQLSMLLSQVASIDDPEDSPCCGEGICESIVGESRADALRSWCYETLGCTYTCDPGAETMRDYYIDLILKHEAEGFP